MRGRAGRCWRHPRCLRTTLWDQGNVVPGRAAGIASLRGRLPKPAHMAAVAAGPGPLLPSEPELIRATMFVCFVNRHQEAPSGLCGAPSPSLAARNAKPIFQCGFCGLGMYFRILIWRPRSELRALPSPSLVSISAPPMLPGTEWFSSGHSHAVLSQPLLGPCCCGEDGGKSPGDVERPRTLLGWAPAGGASQQLGTSKLGSSSQPMISWRHQWKGHL